MMTSKRSLIGVAVLFAIAATGACGSDDSAPPSTPAAGAPAAHAGAGGAPASGGGGATSAGAPGAGAAAAGAPSAGAGGAPTAAGAGGAPTAAGAGGAPSAGAGGAPSAGAGGGSAGGGNTFAAVKTLIGTSCGVGNCHNAASMELNFQGTADLHTLLTTPVASTIKHCGGSTLAVANDANSLILRVTKGATMCSQGGQMVALAKMPDNCTGNKCLTAAQIKILSDWIDAGAPKN